MTARRLITEERGQDLVEYALLALFVALATTVGIGLLGEGMTEAVVQWNVATEACWEMPPPRTGGGC